MEVIPVINCQHIEDVSDRALKAEKFSEWVHLDVSDGRFTFNKSWGDAVIWPRIGNKLKLEVHLMVEEPEKEIDKWIDAGAKRLIIHLETINEKSFSKIKKKADKKGVQFMLAINPETSAEELFKYSKDISEFQILAVYPGPAGQKFLPLVLGKIRFLRREFPNATIEVDGGINEETTKIIKDAGANIVVSGSYIFNDTDPIRAYNKLKEI